MPSGRCFEHALDVRRWEGRRVSFFYVAGGSPWPRATCAGGAPFLRTSEGHTAQAPIPPAAISLRIDIFTSGVPNPETRRALSKAHRVPSGMLPGAPHITPWNGLTREHGVPAAAVMCRVCTPPDAAFALPDPDCLPRGMSAAMTPGSRSRAETLRAADERAHGARCRGPFKPKSTLHARNLATMPPHAPPNGFAIARARPQRRRSGGRRRIARSGAERPSPRAQPCPVPCDSESNASARRCG